MNGRWIVKNVLAGSLFIWICLIVWYEVRNIGTDIQPAVPRVPHLELVKDTPPKQEKIKTTPTNDKETTETPIKDDWTDILSKGMTSLSSSMKESVKEESLGKVGVIETHKDQSTTIEADKEESIGKVGVIEVQSQETPTKEPITSPSSTKSSQTASKQKDGQEDNHTIKPMNTDSDTQTTKLVVTEMFTSKNTSDVINENVNIVRDRPQIKVKADENENVIIDTGSLRENKSSEKRHVVFLKVHKCGSSTVQNIFLRFGYYRNLSFVLGHDNKSLAETRFVNVISYKQSIYESNIVPPPTGRQYDILCCHVIYNQEQFQKFLPNDTVYIGIVREPVKRLESAIHYFKMFKEVGFSDFAATPLKYDFRMPSMANNRMAFEFGFPKESFPPVSSSGKFELIKAQVSDYLKKLDKEFHFIIINERMDESLVYMKRLLRWQLKDILHATLLSAKEDRRRFNEQEAKQLRDYLYLDYALYDFAVKRFEEAISKETNNFFGEVRYFQETNRLVGEFCNSKDAGPLTIEDSQWNDEFVVTKDDCKLYTLFEMTFIQRIRLQQYGRLNN